LVVRYYNNKPENFNQVNVKELIEDIEEEKVIRLLKQVVENN